MMAHDKKSPEEKVNPAAPPEKGTEEQRQAP